MSPKWHRAYLRDKRSAGFYTLQTSAEVTNSIDFTPQQVIALPSLTGTDVIFATPQTNILHLTKKGTNKTNIKIEEYRRNVSFMCDWWEGIGFGIDAAVWTIRDSFPFSFPFFISISISISISFPISCGECKRRYDGDEEEGGKSMTARHTDTIRYDTLCG